MLRSTQVLLAVFVLGVAPSGCGSSTDDGDAEMDVGVTDTAVGGDTSTTDGAGGDTGIDTSTADTGAPDPDGIRCVGSPTECAVGQVCCAGLNIVCQAPDDPCTGDVFACDGPEDCPAGELCCRGAGTSCGGACAGGQICHADAECMSGQSCCPIGGGIPAGGLMFCRTLDPGMSCPLKP